MTKASDNEFPRVVLTTGVATTAPTGGLWELRARADGIYAVSSNTGSPGVGPFGVAGGGGGISASTLSPSSDTYIDSTVATTNFDTATTLIIGGDWADTTFARAILMTIDTSALAGKTIYRAHLMLYRTSTNANATQAGAQLQAKRILRAYVPGEVTWNVYSSGNNWTTAGARSNGNDQATIRHGNMAQGATATDIDLWLELPMTSLLKESLAAAETTFRIKIHQNEADTSQNAMSFASIDHATAALRPTLVVIHSA